jgi:formylglycine-generating enzyme required for sulfatase activity
MATVEAGPFNMGCNGAVDNDCNNNESPYHTVTLSFYQIDIYEVTVSKYQSCIDDGACNNDNGSEPHYYTTTNYSFCNLGASGKDNHPMNCVSWYGAKAYCEWVGKRLLTEAEWEKASRGTDGRIYPWGNEEATCDYAVMYDSGNGCGTNDTMEVGSKPNGVSPYGLYDMSGSVWEWVSDWYGADYYATFSTSNPTGPESGMTRVLRGGSWVSYPYNLRSSSRRNYSPTLRDYDVGFRCAK